MRRGGNQSVWSVWGDEPVKSFLHSISLFSNLSDDDIERLSAITAEIKVSAGVYLFEEGSIGRYFFVIQSGEIDIVTQSGKKELLIAVRKAGEIIGELSLLDRLPRMAAARARTDAHLLLIPRAEFDRLLEHSPTVARQIFYTVLPRWRETERVLREREQEVLDKAAQLEATLQALQQAHDELEQRVDERTAALQRSNQHLTAYIREREGVDEALSGHLFADLPRDDLAWLLETTEEVQLAPGQVLFEEGSAGSCAYLIEAGEVEIYTYADGTERHIALRTDGEMIGEMALLDRSPRLASARARTD